jgi:hypothetical protein
MAPMIPATTRVRFDMSDLLAVSNDGPSGDLHDPTKPRSDIDTDQLGNRTPALMRRNALLLGAAFGRSAPHVAWAASSLSLARERITAATFALARVGRAASGNVEQKPH